LSWPELVQSPEDLVSTRASSPIPAARIISVTGVGIGEEAGKEVIIVYVKKKAAESPGSVFMRQVSR
jgi:hypothetical protein